MALNSPYSDNLGLLNYTFTMNGADVTTAGVNKILVIGDAVVVDDVILEVGASVAAGTGTLLQVFKSDTTAGISTILSASVSALTANVTFDLSTATIHNRSYIPAGTYIGIRTTGANGSAGDIRVTLRCRRTNENCKLQPA